MIKYTIVASVVFAQLAMLAPTSFGLPIDSENGLESRSVAVEERGFPAAFLTMGLINFFDKKHKKDEQKDGNQKDGTQKDGTQKDGTTTQNNGQHRRGLYDVDLDERHFKKRYLEDLVKRGWDDYELEARELDFDQLNELD